MSVQKFILPLLLALVSALVGQQPLSAQHAPPPLAMCRVPEPVDGSPMVRIDARTGRIRAADATHFPLASRVAVVIYNKNPFRYAYEVEIETEDLESRVVNDFLRRLGLQEPAEPPAPAEAAPPPTAQGEPPVQDCLITGLPTGLADTCKRVVVAESALATEAGNLSHLQQKLSAAESAVDKAWSLALEGPSSEAECEQIVTAVHSLTSDLEILIRLKHGEISPGAIKEIADRFHGSLAVDLVTIGAMECPQDQTPCEAAVADLKRRAEAALATAGRLSKDAAVLNGAYAPSVPKRKAQKQLIAQVLGDVDAFVETLHLAQPTDPTRYRLTIKRTERSPPHAESSVSVPDIVVGRSRFSVSGGIGVSFFETEEFGRQSGLDQNDAVVPVFAVTSESKHRRAALVQLNGCIVRCLKQRFSLHWSLGLGVGAGEEPSEFDLYTGPAIGFIDGKLLFTFAFHQREKEELVGFRVGDPIPEGVTDPLPTRSSEEAALLITVTYKLR